MKAMKVDVLVSNGVNIHPSFYSIKKEVILNFDNVEQIENVMPYGDNHFGIVLLKMVSGEVIYIDHDYNRLYERLTAI
jgi:hypothetical protein